MWVFFQSAGSFSTDYMCVVVVDCGVFRTFSIQIYECQRALELWSLRAREVIVIGRFLLLFQAKHLAFHTYGSKRYFDSHVTSDPKSSNSQNSKD